MITSSELFIVLGAFALVGGYIAIIHQILTQADGMGKTDLNEMCRHK